MSRHEDSSVSCDDCWLVPEEGEKVYCEQCAGKKYLQEDPEELALKNKALKFLFKNEKAYNIEEILGLSQLEYLTLRDIMHR